MFNLHNGEKKEKKSLKDVLTTVRPRVPQNAFPVPPTRESTSILIAAGRLLDGAAAWLMRLGGSLADHLHYGDACTVAPPGFGADDHSRFGFGDGCLTEARWVALNELCAAATDDERGET